MALTAKFVADFSSFYEATQKAEVSLKGFDAQANKVNASVNRMADQFSGRKLIQEATLMSAAIEKIGGASNLTEKELAQVSAKAGEAVAKLRQIGEKVPADLQALANQAKPIAGTFDTMKSAVMGAAGALGIAFGGTAIVNAIKAQIGAALEYADQLSNLSASTSISVQGLQRLESIGVTSGVSMQTLAGAVETLQRKLDDQAAKGAIRQMGLDYAYIRSLSPENQFLELAKAISKIEDPVARANAGAAIFGKQWSAIAPALKQDVDKIIKSVKTMSDEQVAALDASGDAWDEWKLSTSRSLRGFMGDLILSDKKFQESQFIWNQKPAALAMPALPSNPLLHNITVGGTTTVDPSAISALQLEGRTLDETRIKAEAKLKTDEKAGAASKKYADDVTQSLERVRLTTVGMGDAAVRASQNVAGFTIRQSEAVTINRDFSAVLTESTIKADAFGHVLLTNVAPSLKGMGDAAHQAGLRQKETASFTDTLNKHLGGIESILGGIQTAWAQAAVVGSRAVQDITSALKKGDWVGAIVAATAALVPFIAKLFGASEESKKVSPMRDEFFKLQGGLETLNPKVQALEGNLASVQAVFDAKTVQQYEAAMKNLEAILAREQSTFDELTESAEDYGRALKKIPTKIPIQVDYNTSGSGGGDVPGFAGGTGGKFVDFGSGSLVMLHGREAVVPAGQSAGGGGGVAITIHAQGAFFDTPGDLQRLADKVNQALTAKFGQTNRTRAA